MSEEKEVRHIGLEIHRTSKRIHRYIASMSSMEYANEMTGMHAWILRFLYEHREEEVFQKDIEKRFDIRRSTATGLLQLMEKNGLIYREPVSYDARLKRIIMTEKAASIHASVESKIDSMERQISRDLSPEEIETLSCLLEKIRNNLRTEHCEN